MYHYSFIGGFLYDTSDFQYMSAKAYWVLVITLGLIFGSMVFAFGGGWGEPGQNVEFGNGCARETRSRSTPAWFGPERTLPGHVDNVNAVVWSPDGSKVVTASKDGTVKLWDPSSWNCTNTLTEHGDHVNAVTWSPDGSMFASSSARIPCRSYLFRALAH